MIGIHLKPRDVTSGVASSCFKPLWFFAHAFVFSSASTMYRQAHQHLQRLPRRWLVAAAFVSSITAFAWLAYCAHSDLTQSFDQLEYGCQRPPPSIWRKYLPVEHLEHENHHTFMSSPGSKILMLQHCVYPSKRMIMPLSNHQVRPSPIDEARLKALRRIMPEDMATRTQCEQAWSIQHETRRIARFGCAITASQKFELMF